MVLEVADLVLYMIWYALMTWALITLRQTYQALVAFSKMSFAIHQVFISRLEKRYSVQLLDKANRSMKLIAREPERFALEIAEIEDIERPPMISVPTYNVNRMIPEIAL